MNHMGLFNFSKKDNKAEQNQVASTATNPATDKATVERLCKNAGNIVAMLKSVLAGPQGTDLCVVALYAAGLAGIACHEAVKATGKTQVVVGVANGKKYYMGDAVN